MAYTQHEIYICDYGGRRLDLLDDFTSAQFTRIVNGVGSCSVVLPPTYSESQLRIGSWIEYWRAPVGNVLQPEGLYLLDGYAVKRDNKGVRSLTLQGSHVNGLLGWRVAKPPNVAQAVELTMPGDNMIKYLARTTMTAAATDPTRSLASYYNFAVDFDTGEAPTHTRDVSGTSVLETANNIVKALQTDDTAPYWLYWEIIPTGFDLDFGLELRTYGGYDERGQRGRNRGPNSLNPMVLSVDNNTLAEATYERKHDKEVTFVYTLGKIYDTATYDWVFLIEDDVRSNLFPANRRERYISASGSTKPEALKALREGRPVNRITAKFTENQSVRYGVEVMLGDRLAFEMDGHIQHVRAESVSISLQQQKEAVDVKLEPVELTATGEFALTFTPNDFMVG